MGGAVGNLVGEITGSNAATKSAEASANFAGQAAQAQQAESGRQFNLINTTSQNLQNDAVAQSSKYNVQQLNALDSSLSAQQEYLGKQQQLLAAVDPTLMEASKQALALLQGGKSSTQDVLQNQRAQQRQLLVNSLKEQYGPGAESSSIGQQALNKFDQDSATTFAGAQQSTLGMLLGSAQQSGANNNVAQTAQGIAQTGQGYGNIANANTQALLNAGQIRLGALAGAGQNQINSAGGQFTAGVLTNQARANGQQANANAITGLAGVGLGAFAGGVGKAAGASLFSGSGAAS